MRRAGIAMLAALACATGCGDDDGPTAVLRPEREPRGGEVVDVRSLFPASPGDRWRSEAGERGTAHNSGVTGVEPSGAAVVHGTGHALAERYRVTPDGVTLVDPAGEALVPLLEAPVRPGAEWRYSLRDGAVEVPCHATVRTAGVAERVAGATLEGCAEIRRVCRYPEGDPFPVDTTHTTDELYCPGVGRVREVGTFDPPPSSSILPARRTERVVGWRVAGAPSMPSQVSFGCDSFILLPSDVQAACGTAIQPVEPVAGEPGDERCSYRFRSPSGALRITAERRREELSDDDVDRALLDGAEDAQVRAHDGVRVLTGGPERFGLSVGRILVTVAADEGTCPEASALRLAPLLRSLIAR